MVITEAPRLHVNWKPACLLALHVSALALSITMGARNPA
jgi:hypothetical protein